MTIAAWRVVLQKYAESPYSPFDGEGARVNGGRWNSAGVPVVYTSATLSLAVLETLVHADGELAALLGRVAFEVAVPEEVITEIALADLPRGWSDPVAPPTLKALGDAWVSGGSSPVLRIPSAVVTVEYNYVLNPRHPDFGKLAIGPGRPLPIDPRLLPARPAE